MNIQIIVVCIEQRFTLREMRKKAQLDLRVVGINQEIPLPRDEQLAQFPSHFRTDGNILQIGVGA